MGARFSLRIPGTKLVCQLFLFITLMFAAACAAQATTFTVTKTADTNDNVCDADCSFREAIIAANNNPGQDKIAFSIGSGVQSIMPLSVLPNISESVIIDGTTQPGFAGLPIIEINGTNAGANTPGLRIGGDHSTIRGLVINGFSTSYGIEVGGLGGHIIAGNFVGLDVTGTVKKPNFTGIAVTAADNIIGGTTLADRNIISGNDSNSGIAIGSQVGNGNFIQGNYIGTDVTGTIALGNNIGIYVISNCSNNTIGGSTAGARNLISGNGGPGLTVTTIGNKVMGNYIGTKADGINPLPNASGIDLSDGHDNTIGGANPGEGNVIAFNALHGIGLAKGTDRNAILGNSIFDNDKLGIDLGADGVTANDQMDIDTGPQTANAFQNYPVLNSVTPNGNNTDIGGSLNSIPNTQFRLEFFSSTAVDLTGFGEGQKFLGATTATTNGNGDVNFTFSVSTASIVGTYITATATDPSNNTSEFSKAKQNGNAGTIQFSSATYNVNENGGSATITITRTGGTLGGVTINYATSNGTATAGVDYTAASGLKGWVDGDSSSKTFTIPITNDSFDEADETVNITLSSPSPGVTLGTANAVLTITDNDPAPTISINDVSQAEGNAGTSNFTFTATLSAASGQTVTANYATADGTAQAPGDYLSANGLISFAPGETSKPVIIMVNGDPQFESNETFLVNLSNAANATFGKAQGTGSIVNDDTAPTLSINDVSQAEGNAGTSTFTFTATLSAASGQTVTADYATADGTAQAPGDYLPANGLISFAPGETSKPINVSVNGETQFEGNETFLVNLSNVTNATVGKGQGTGTIVNDDNMPPPTLQFSQANSTVQEDLGALTITVTRSGDTSVTASVDYKTLDGSATQKGDFEYAAGTLRFAAGDTSKTFQILINEDMFLENAESFSVALSNPGGASLGAQSTTTVNITDDAPESITNPIDDAQSFVYMQYHDLLNREPDAAGLQFWTNQITACGSDQTCVAARRESVSAAFFLSIEFQETGFLVERMYKASYGNMPGAPVPLTLNEFVIDSRTISQGVIVNQAGWQQKLDANKQAFVTEFVQRTRFVNAYPTSMTPAQFVDALFINTGVTPTSSERQAVVARFGGAGNSSDVSARVAAVLDVSQHAGFAQAETNRAFVLMEYFGYLRRNPNDAPELGLNLDGYNFWLNKLNLFNGNYVDAEMVKAFLKSTEYRQRFGL